MRYVIEHNTVLTFPRPVREHQCELRLAPQENTWQRVSSTQITVDPAADLFTYTDVFGNRVHHFGLISPHECLVTRLSAEVETLMTNPFDYDPIPVPREREWIADALHSDPRFWDYMLHRSPATPDLDRLGVAELDLVLPVYDTQRPLLESVQAAMEWIDSTLSYEAGTTDVHSPLKDVLAARSGVCQDYAHLLIALVRWWGFPARYAMGYLDPGYFESETAVTQQATHAWAEVLIPGAGWRGFDATHRLVTNETYIAVAVGRDSLDAAPQRGAFKGEGGGEPPEITLKVTNQQ